MAILTTKTLLPGQHGTLKEVEQYGDRLVFVRYKTDTATGNRIKTIEIITEKRTMKAESFMPFNKLVRVRIEFEEIHLQKLARSVGANWNGRIKRWIMKYGDAFNLGLGDRIESE